MVRIQIFEKGQLGGDFTTEVVVLDWPLNIYAYNGCQK